MIERSKIIEKDDSEYGKEYVLLSDARTYGDQRAAEAREQMREECATAFGVSVAFLESKVNPPPAAYPFPKQT